MKYLEEARQIWQGQVPAKGQADTVQGELLRDVEKLRWEAQTNGNVNWDGQFELLTDFIETTLCGSGLFDADAIREIRADLSRLRKYELPETSDEPYDRLSDRAVEWSQAQAGPVPRAHNPRLRL